MSRKGISPLIAAVLLIAFTMAVASMFAQWAPDLQRGIQSSTSNQSDKIQSCLGKGMEFLEGNASQATIQQTKGDALGNVSITWQYANRGPVRRFVTLNGNSDFATETNGVTGATLEKIEASAMSCDSVSAYYQ